MLLLLRGRQSFGMLPEHISFRQFWNLLTLWFQIIYGHIYLTYVISATLIQIKYNGKRNRFRNMNEYLCQIKYCTLFILLVISVDFYFLKPVKMNVALIYHITEESCHMF